MEYRCNAVRQNNSQRISALAGFFVAALLAGWLWLNAKRPALPVAPARGLTNGVAAAQAEASATPVGEDKLKMAANKLAGASDAAGKNSALIELKSALASGSVSEPARAIRQLLDSKMDAPTGRGFKIGKGGMLTEAPTLRAWLLDQLAQIDPAAAAEYAKIILQSKDSPDEWALALRNLALGDASKEARALLAGKTGELLGAKDWQQNPAASYLEAFDTVVFLGGTDFVPTLAGLVSTQDNPALAHAAFLTLDRLVIHDPTAMLSTLLEHPALMSGREQTRADYFARADVSNPKQLELLQNYLLQTSTAERQQFAGVFPNANFMVSANLLTQSPALDQGEIKKRDAESLKVVQQWLADPRFAGARPELEKIQVRLQEFVRQASQP